MTKTEYDNLFKYYDKNFEESVDYIKFMWDLRGELSQRRRELVIEAFKKLDVE